MERETLYIVTRVAIIIAVVVGILRWRNVWKTNLKWFPLYLIFCAGVEIIGNIAELGVVTITYTLYDIVTYIFFTYYFYVVLKRDLKIAIYGTLYTVILIISLIVEDVRSPLAIQSTAGTFLIFLITITYFISLMRSDQVLNFTRLPSFWIAIGLLVFNLGYLPITFSLNASLLPSEETVYGILVILGVVLYGCFTIALLCKKAE